MTKNEFYAAIAENVLSFFPPSYADAEVMIEERVKTGDIQLHGLMITKDKSTPTPIVYLDKFWDQYLRGEKFERIITEIAADYAQAVRNTPEIDIPNFDENMIKDKVHLRVLDKSANRDFLSQHPSLDLGCGYAATMYIPIEGLEGRVAMTQITNDLMGSFDLDSRELFERAMENTAKEQPAVFSSIEDILFGFGGNKLLLNDLSEVSPESGLMAITNENSHMGSIGLFYPDAQEKIGELLGENYFVLPSSIHEVLIMRESMAPAEPKQMAEMVHSINENQVAPEDRLGNRVMYYDREAKELTVAADYDRDREKSQVHHRARVR